MAFAMTPATALNPWLQILAALEKKVIRQSFDTWFKPTRYSHAAGRTLYVRVPSAEFQHIGDKYGDLIQEAIDLQSLEFDDVCFVTVEDDPSVPPVRRDGGFGPVHPLIFGNSYLRAGILNSLPVLLLAVACR